MSPERTINARSPMFALLAWQVFASTVMLALLLGGTPGIVGASLQDTQQQPDARIRVNVNLVLVEATVKDRAGRVMKDLKKEDFVLDEDGAPQEIAHFSRDQLPLAVT